MKIRPRTVTAALTAPAVGAVVAFVLVVVLLDLAEDLGPRGLARFFGDFMMVGSAVAYLVCAAVGVPAYAYLWRRNGLRFHSLVLVSSLGGVIAFLPVLRVMTGSAGAFGGTTLLGAVSGACAGAWFWLVAFGRRRPDTQDQPA